jgi:hypothetical protein
MTLGRGGSFTFRHPILRPLAAADATFNFFAQLMLTLFVLYAVRDARLSSSQIGVVYAAFGLGGLAAATALGRVVTRVGYGRLLIGGYLTGALAIAAAFRCPRCGWCSRRSPRCGRNRRYGRPPGPTRRPPVRPAPGRMTAPPGSLRCRAPHPARAHRLPQLCGG